MQTTLVIFSGLPGTGKSTLADKLARELCWPLLRIDDVVGEVPENPNVAFWDSKVAILLGLTDTQLELGLSVHESGSQSRPGTCAQTPGTFPADLCLSV